MKRMFAPNVYDISNEVYHGSEGISRSGIMLFRKTPKHFWNIYLNPLASPKRSTPAMEFGSALHMYILEPEKFHEEYYLMEPNSHHGSSKLGKEFKANQIELSNGRQIIDQEDYDELFKIRESVWQSSDVREVIEGAKYEQSIYWKDKETGLLCKARPDIWQEHFIADIKSTCDASEHSFRRDFYENGGHVQMAMIQEGIKEVTGYDMNYFIALAFEKTAPYAEAIYPLDESLLEKGKQEFHETLRKMADCFEKDIWPGYEPTTLFLPSYIAIKG